MKRNGFTLIEILVVIVLIGILAGLLIVSFQGVRKSARDGKRKADLEQIRSGLEMCRQQYRKYPTGSGATNYLGDGMIDCSSLIPSGITDPLASYRYYYIGSADGSTFTLCAFLEGGAATTCASGVTCSANCDSAGTTTPCNYITCNP